VCSSVLAVVWDIPKLWILSGRSRVTAGRVIDVQPMNHGAARVEVVVGGRAYQAVVAGHGESVGQKIELHYDPQDPARIEADDPKLTLKMQAALWAASSLMMAVAVLVIFWRLRVARPSMFTPSLIIGLMALGSVIGTVSSVYFNGPSWRLAGSACVFTGCFLALREALRRHATWADLLRSGPFYLGVSAMLLGEILILAL
jgi:hypothetical protein